MQDQPDAKAHRRLPGAGTDDAFLLSSGCLSGREVHTMLDLVYVALTVGFFALAWVYARACDRL